VRRGVIPLLVCLLAISAAGCGSSAKHVATVSAQQTVLRTMEKCLRRHGYQIHAEEPNVRRTAPKNFEFVAVWNLLNPNRIALAVTISRTPDGAARAAAWLRKTNKKIAKGAVHAPVAQFGRIDVLWTAQPNRGDMQAIYPCVRPSA
jgi:hypothetical protein